MKEKTVVVLVASILKENTHMELPFRNIQDYRRVPEIGIFLIHHRKLFEGRSVLKNETLVAVRHVLCSPEGLKLSDGKARDRIVRR